nr:unnamed protein product [Spirometra erinaceieuropaei]
MCLPSQEGTVVGSEERSSASGWRVVNSFYRGEEVLPLVAVRVALDLPSLASRPGVLHLTQSQLKQAATTTECSFVVLSGVVDACFVKAVLLGENVSDGGVVVVETVLVLAACATEDGQRRRLDCVPQLTSSVLHIAEPAVDKPHPDP